MSIKSDIKALFKAFTVALGGLVLIAFFFIVIFFIALETKEESPKVNYYKNSLEFMVSDTLPSFKVIKQKYRSKVYAIAVIKLSELDYNKVLNAAKTNKPLQLKKEKVKSEDSGFQTILSEADYNRRMESMEATDSAFVANSKFKLVDKSEHLFSMFYPYSDEAETLMKKANFFYSDIKVIYEWNSTILGFVSKNIIIFYDRH
jgi:hypothetical protein